jgi:hypothetical protein
MRGAKMGQREGTRAGVARPRSRVLMRGWGGGG